MDDLRKISVSSPRLWCCGVSFDKTVLDHPLASRTSGELPEGSGGWIGSGAFLDFLGSMDS